MMRRGLFGEFSGVVMGDEVAEEQDEEAEDEDDDGPDEKEDEDALILRVIFKGPRDGGVGEIGEMIGEGGTSERVVTDGSVSWT
jgi:hypothetical protein